MNIIAFESSCDETSVAVVEDGRKVLSSHVASQTDIHALYGGVVPEIASRKHLETIAPLCRLALEDAGLTKHQIDAVAVTYAPGLIGALLVGINFAKAFAMGLGLPLIPVHHIRGHLAAAYLTDAALEPPFLGVVVSGGHTLMLDVQSYTRMEILATTRDDAAGEALDKAARVLGLGYPGGAALSRMAESGDPKRYPLQPAKLRDSKTDMSFSGLKTAFVNIVHNQKQKGGDLDIPSLCASFERTVCDSLIPGILAFSRRLGHPPVVLAGGVAANRLLRRELRDALGDRLCVPPIPLCGDNAAMIGSQAYYEWKAGEAEHTAQWSNWALNGAASLGPV